MSWRGLVATMATVMLAVAVTWLGGCGRQPQIGSDETARQEAEALFTAVTARRMELLEASRVRLKTLHEKGQIPSAAFQALEQIADQAEEGDWEPAAKALWAMMRGQAPSEE